MFDVPCGTERATIDREALVDVGPPLPWAARLPTALGTIALRIDGNEEGPYARLITLAEIVLPLIQPIEVAADAYLRSWIDPAAQFYEGAWKVRALQLSWDALPAGQRGSDFEVRLSIRGDDYGEWSVRFMHHTVPSSKLVPYVFSRRQW